MLTLFPPFSRFCKRLSFYALAFMFLLPCASGAGAKENSKPIYPGYRTLSSSLPEQHLMLQIAVWYPTMRKPETVKVAELSFTAARNAPLCDGVWPVLVLSHDVTGNAWSHHDLAARLAQTGFIIIAPTHDHDNADDMSLFFSDRELPLRSLQVKAALDIVLKHPLLGKQADTERIGFIGFGTPASAGLLLAGASLASDIWPIFYSPTPSSQPHDALPLHTAPSKEKPYFEPPVIPPLSLPQEVPLEEKSKNSPLVPIQNKSLTNVSSVLTTQPPSTARQESPWCTPLIAEYLDTLIKNMKQRSVERAEKLSMRNKAVKERERLFKRLTESVARSHQRQKRLANARNLPIPPIALPLLPPLSHDRSVQDLRFHALAFVSPGFSILFSKKSLDPVRLPTLFIGAGKERWNLPAEQAERFVAMLSDRAEYHLFPEADGPSFQSACQKADPLYPLGDICRSVSEDEREDIHARLADLLQDFFQRAFQAGIPAPQEKQAHQVNLSN